VVFRYRPLSYRAGRAISIVSVLTAVAAAIVLKRRSRHE
jgi:hypothetical protein